MAARGALADYERDVKSAKAQLWNISGAATGVILTRFERIGCWRELVIVAGAGRGLTHVVPKLIALAKRLNLDGIRTHVTRVGLVRMYLKHGFAASHHNDNEIILRWVNGR